MNQSLMALVLNGVVDIGVAQAASSSPEDFERDMRKFLFAADRDATLGDEMSDSKADFSKIVELQEIKRLYDECQERHQLELSEKERIIEELRGQIGEKQLEINVIHDSTSGSQEVVEKAKKEVAFVRKELEGKVAKLQARVKELTASQTAEPSASGSRRGFFSR